MEYRPGLRLKSGLLAINAAEVLEKLLQGPPLASDFLPCFPAGTRVHAVEVEHGIATVNLSRHVRAVSGSQGEKAAVYSIVCSLLSLEGIKGVKILIEGEAARTLAGHVDISEVFFGFNGVYLTKDGTVWEGTGPRVAIVVDDLGAAKPSETNKLLQLDIPLTVAILPDTPVSEKVAREAARQGHEVILHLPMEPHAGKPSWLGNSAIIAHLGEEEIESRFVRALDTVPGAWGFNNHMGSKATESRRVVAKLMDSAAKKELIVLDSCTTPNSVIPELAQDYGIPFAKRTFFLDGPENKGQVERQLRLLAEAAKEYGVAVGIGHVGTESSQTVEVLQRKARLIMEAAGVELVFLSELVK